VNVDLDVLHAPVVNRVDRHVDGADVVTVDNGGRSEGNVKLLKKLADPAALGDDVSYRTVLSLGVGPGHRSLAL
jgi:hypothetical protein